MEAKGDFIDGRFVLPATPDEQLDWPSPADLNDRVGAFPVAHAHVGAAVDAARRAQPAWEALPLEQRSELLQRFGREIKARESLLIELLGREVGKPIWDAKAEVNALVGKIGITLDEGLKLVRDFESEDGKLACRYRPHGVLAVIGPFNFPLHLAHGHIVPAIATGNTVVFKPSEIAPACAQIYAEAAEAAGFPKGVINVVQGRGASGAKLSEHPDIDGLLFTGSYETGTQILAANATRPGRMLALELGGKNAGIVLADAPWEKTLHDLVFSAFATSGQRCTEVSRIFVERSISDRFAEAFVAAAKRVVVGRPNDPGTFMGPLATRRGFDKFREAQRLASSEGAETLLATRSPQGLNGYYAPPSVHWFEPNADSRYATMEIFGPDVAITAVDDIERACSLANATPYGLTAGIYTADKARFEACAQRLRVGCLAWNCPTVGSSSRLPFGGVKNSGNHRPAALFSTLYCTYPVAVMAG